jgi:hypothetical protein
MEPMCPYVGIIDDPKTSTVFPDNCNACHRADPPRAVVLDHQRIFCLTERHTECEGYINGWENGFPRSLRNKNCRSDQGILQSKSAKFWGILLAVLVLLVLLGVFVVYPNLDQIAILSPQTETPVEVIQASATEQVIANTPTPTTTPTVEPTQTPTPTHTPTATAGPALMTPFGSPELQLLVYEVTEGDSLAYIANIYNTTTDILMALNRRESLSVFVGERMVVCVDCTQMPDLPPLQPLFLEEDTHLQDLAEDCDCSTAELRRWNDLGDGDWIRGGRWVVVPLGGDS